MELTLDQALQKGVEAHKAGNVQEADRYYTAILKANPKHPDANHNLGVLAVGVGKAEVALPFFKTALEISPNIEQFWLSYIDALLKLDRMADATAVFNQAKSSGAKGNGFDQLEKRLGLSQNPKVVDSSNIQDPSKEQLQPLIDLYGQGQYQQVLNDASQLLLEFPKSVMLLNIVGATSQGLGKLDEAIEAYKKAISVKSDSAKAYNNMGVALKEQQKLDEAIEAYKKAFEINPEYAEAYYNMGVILQQQSKLDKALEAYKKALSINPNDADAYNNVGTTLQNQGKLEEAIEAYKKALSIRPDYGNSKHMLSALTGITLKNAPREYVENLFDGYSKNFEASLVDKLDYKIPKLVSDILIKPNSNGSLGSVLDLGCGSGLLGPEIRDHCSQLEGIDLSKKMLELANQKKRLRQINSL